MKGLYMKKNAVYGLLLTGVLLTQSALRAVEGAVVPAPVAPAATASYLDYVCPGYIWDAAKENPGRAALVVALAAAGASFWAVYDNDKSFVDNLKNFPNNLWIRINNAIAAAQNKKKCY